MITGESVGSERRISSSNSIRAWTSAVLFEPTLAPAAAGLSGAVLTGP
jgi:hypothetical protein